MTLIAIAMVVISLTLAPGTYVSSRAGVPAGARNGSWTGRPGGCGCFARSARGPGTAERPATGPDSGTP